jgi:hypothetical protein
LIADRILSLMTRDRKRNAKRSSPVNAIRLIACMRRPETVSGNYDLAYSSSHATNEISRHFLWTLGTLGKADSLMKR